MTQEKCKYMSMKDSYMNIQNSPNWEQPKCPSAGR